VGGPDGALPANGATGTCLGETGNVRSITTLEQCTAAYSAVVNTGLYTSTFPDGPKTAVAYTDNDGSISGGSGYVLGNLGQSCTTVCSTHGACASTTMTDNTGFSAALDGAIYVDNGNTIGATGLFSPNNCQTAGGAADYTSSMFIYPNYCPSGCATKCNYYAYTNSDCAGSDPNLRRLCSCSDRQVTAATAADLPTGCFYVSDNNHGLTGVTGNTLYWNDPASASPNTGSCRHYADNTPPGGMHCFCTYEYIALSRLQSAYVPPHESFKVQTMLAMMGGMMLAVGVVVNMRSKRLQRDSESAAAGPFIKPVGWAQEIAAVNRLLNGGTSQLSDTPIDTGTEVTEKTPLFAAQSSPRELS